jgi:GNAT superfamily N-acetyltransferase
LTIRRLGPGDEEIVVQLGGERPLTHAQAADLVADERTLYLVAFDRQEPVGYVFAHQLPRRHGDPSQLFVYDLEVNESSRRRGIATALMRKLELISREHSEEPAQTRTTPCGSSTTPSSRPPDRRRRPQASPGPEPVTRRSPRCGRPRADVPYPVLS